MEKNSSNGKLASAHLFTIVCRPPSLKIMILFMTFNDILWHFNDLFGHFMTYVQLTKGVKVTLEDKLINPIDWCISRIFSGMFSGMLRQDFKGINFSFFFDPYFDNFPCKLIRICHANVACGTVAQMQFKRPMWHKCSSKPGGNIKNKSQSCNNKEIVTWQITGINQRR